MIRSFRHKGLERFFRTGNTSGIQTKHAKRLRLILAQLDRAVLIGDMDFPGSGLHPLKGDRKEIWSVTVQANWRITLPLREG